MSRIPIGSARHAPVRARALVELFALVFGTAGVLAITLALLVTALLAHFARP